MESLEGVLRKHVIKFHHNQNICETCGRVFNDPRLFDVHVKSAHSDVRDHFCDRCGKVSPALWCYGVLFSPNDNWEKLSQQVLLHFSVGIKPNYFKKQSSSSSFLLT